MLYRYAAAKRGDPVDIVVTDRLGVVEEPVDSV
jgi:hypothetical protein